MEFFFSYLIENHRMNWSESMKQLIKEILIKIYKLITNLIPVNRKIIIFQSSNGRNYTGNPKYIYEEMVRQGLDKEYKCIWFLFDTQTKIPGNCKKVRCNLFRSFWYLMRAGIWVFDSRQPDFYVKKKNIVFIETWHGTPLKKLGLDMDKLNMAGNKDIDNYHARFRRACNDWDYLISQNRFSTDIFNSCFAFQGKPMLEIGYPRNDVLFEKNNQQDIDKLKAQLGLPMDKKIILYAPTWRDNEYSERGRYKFASKLDFDKAREELGDEYVFIVKYHYLVSDKIDWTPYKGFVYTFDETKDIAWLYLVSDMMITDYSSVMFDYSLLRRPMFFFAYDLEDYKNNLRGFYFDFMEEVPGPISRDTDQLIHDIKTYDAQKWTEKYSAYHKKFNGVDDGHASQKVIDVIKKVSSKKR